MTLITTEMRICSQNQAKHQHENKRKYLKNLIRLIFIHFHVILPFQSTMTIGEQFSLVKGLKKSFLISQIISKAINTYVVLRCLLSSLPSMSNVRVNPHLRFCRTMLKPEKFKFQISFVPFLNSISMLAFQCFLDPSPG